MSKNNKSGGNKSPKPENVSRAEEKLTEETGAVVEEISDAVQETAEAAAETVEKGAEAAEKTAGTAAPEKASEEKKKYFAIERNEGGKVKGIVFGANTEKPIILDLRLMWKLLSYMAAVLIFLTSVGITIYYVTVASKGEFHSDCTDTIMWANASHESGSVYDETFHYACFLPFGINLIMQPYLSVYGLSMTTHIIGMMGFFILFTVFFFLMLKELHWDIRWACIGTSLLLAMTLSSQKVREIFWGHTIYYSLGLLFVIMGMYMYARLRNLADKRKTLIEQGKSPRAATVHYCITFVILCVFVLFTATDGISGLSIFALPFLAGILAEGFVDNKTPLLSKKFGSVVLKAAIFGIMVVLGLKLNDHWLGDMTAGYQDANSNFSALDTWTDHVHSLPIAWMKLMGVKSMAGERLFEKDGIFNIIYIFNSLLLFVIPIVATFFYPKYENAKGGKMLRMWIWVHWAVTAIIFLGYICGVLSGADWRLIPAIGTAIIVTILFAHWAVANKTSAGRVAAVLMIPMIVASYNNLNTVREMPKDSYKDNVLFALSDYLEDEGLTYGYATFWNANAITVISGSNVCVRDVTVDENGVWKRLYQSSDRWYDEQEGQEEYFLLLSVGEYNALSAAENNIIGTALREYDPVLNNIEWRILVFDHNIF